MQIEMGIMRPEHIIWIEHGKYSPDMLVNWCFKNVGEPYPTVDFPTDYTPRGFDYNDPKGKWCSFQKNNVGDGRFIDTWCFREESDATMFALRWS